MTLTKFIIAGAKECVEGAKARLMEIADDLEQMTEIECIIPQKHHRSLLGNKGKHVQEISAKYSVQIKFPDRRPKPDEQQQSPVEEQPSVDEGETGKNDIIMILGKKDNAEAAKANLMVGIVGLKFSFHHV